MHTCSARIRDTPIDAAHRRAKSIPAVKDALKEYRIPFSGLAPGQHTFQYSVGQDLFEHFGYSDTWSDARIDVRAVLTKRPNMMELAIAFTGDVLTPCDATGEEFRLPVSGSQTLIVKQGDVPGEEDDVITLGREEIAINIAQYVYETIVLNIPQKRYHPDYLSGRLVPAAGYFTGETPEETSSKGGQTEEIDPRWAKLKDIKN